MKSMLAILLVALLLPATAVATSFYIDPVHGSDTGDGSAADPWGSLQTVLEGGLIATQDWASHPYEPGTPLEPVNPDALIRAGDTIWLRSGYYGDVVIARKYNSAPITIAAVPGQAPRLRSLRVEAAQNWILRGLSISPSYGPDSPQITMVQISSHNYFGPTRDVELSHSDVFSVADAAAWGADEWVNLASSGINVSGDRVSVHDNTVRNVRFGISVSGVDASIRGNLIDGFSADGLRGLGDRGVFAYNRVQNVKVGGDAGDPNHDDGFQSWSVGSGGVGTGAVTGVVLRGNVFIDATDPDAPLATTMQGIGCFDGLFVDWVVENNIVVVDHWHGISFYGMRDSRIVNNTVIARSAAATIGPPWIMVTAHKDGRRSSNVVVRNNLATHLTLDADDLARDHNLQFSMTAAPDLFVAPPLNVYPLPDSAAIDSGSPELAPDTDIDGVARPQGAGFDLGAHEWRDLIFADGFQP